jgi:hypothetical protein
LFSFDNTPSSRRRPLRCGTPPTKPFEVA